MAVWYNATTAFSSKPDNVDNTQLRPTQSKWEEVGSQSLKVRIFIVVSPQSLQWIDANGCFPLSLIL